MNRNTIRLAEALLLSVLVLPAGASAGGASQAIDDRALTSDEMVWLHRLLPNLEPQDALPREINHSLGKRLLPKSLGGQSWFVHSLRTPLNEKDSAALGILLLEGDRMRKGPIHYPLGNDVLLGIPFLAKGGTILAVIDKPLFIDRHSYLEPAPSLSLKKVTLWALEEVMRSDGTLHRHRLYFRKNRNFLRSAGAVPVLASNLGRCGSLERAKRKRRTLGGKKKCGLLYHLQTTLKESRRGLSVREELRSSRYPRFSIKKRTGQLQYRWTGKRLQPNRKSLWVRIPDSS